MPFMTAIVNGVETRVLAERIPPDSTSDAPKGHPMKGYVLDQGFFVFADCMVRKTDVRVMADVGSLFHVETDFGSHGMAKLTPDQETNYRPMSSGPTGPTDEPDELFASSPTEHAVETDPFLPVEPNSPLWHTWNAIRENYQDYPPVVAVINQLIGPPEPPIQYNADELAAMHDSD